ncbi:unnamed protein product [Timema podura]|uniref:Uncharacterized protein n=1 Tax=Timema podura TaxID=61482 RepID=A0ABN7NLK9_TIMPD|nr:unnamed protein product [Timema podura]
MERDRNYLTKLPSELEEYSPFSEETTLQNIITGINADMNVNVQNLFSAGNITVKQIEGQNVFDYSYTRKNKVKTSACARGIKVRKYSLQKTFVKRKRLPPTTSATKLHSRWVYLQVMQWLGENDNMDPTKWGWENFFR